MVTRATGPLEASDALLRDAFIPPGICRVLRRIRIWGVGLRHFGVNAEELPTPRVIPPGLQVVETRRRIFVVAGIAKRTGGRSA